MRIAILGGTGSEGLGIATRLAALGEEIVIGSRSSDRATEAAASIRARVPGARITGQTNPDAAGQGEIVFLAVPYEGIDHIIATCGPEMAGKIVVDTIVPLRVEKGLFDVLDVPEGSAAERIQARLPASRVVSALKNQSSAHLVDLAEPMDADVLLCGADVEAKSRVADLIGRIDGIRVIDSGGLRSSRILERMTALLMNLNRKYKARTSFRITGL